MEEEEKADLGNRSGTVGVRNIGKQIIGLEISCHLEGRLYAREERKKKSEKKKKREKKKEFTTTNMLPSSSVQSEVVQYSKPQPDFANAHMSITNLRSYRQSPPPFPRPALFIPFSLVISSIGRLNPPSFPSWPG